MNFSAHHRIRTSREFQKILQHGAKRNCGCFILKLIKHSKDTPIRESRLGIIASKKVGNAVKRNRAKRLFREIFRKNQKSFLYSCDIVIIVFSNFDTYTYDELEKRFINAIQLLKQNEKSH